MKWIIYIGILLLLLESCVKESICPCLSEGGLEFRMKDIPVTIEGDSVETYSPYNKIATQIAIMGFYREALDTTLHYDYEYCQSHYILPFPLKTWGSYEFLIIGNLMDEKAMSWKYNEEGRLLVMFRIVNHEEPSIYLVANKRVNYYRPVRIPVALKMLVARLEVKMVNPPAWVTGVDFVVSQVADRITNTFQLQDTTSIYKSFSFQQGEQYASWLGVNTFPNYSNEPALVDIKLKGSERIAHFIVNDDRIHLQPGKIVRMTIEFENNTIVNISVEVDGKWEEINEGHIEI